MLRDYIVYKQCFVIQRADVNQGNLFKNSVTLNKRLELVTVHTNQVLQVYPSSPPPGQSGLRNNCLDFLSSVEKKTIVIVKRIRRAVLCSLMFLSDLEWRRFVLKGYLEAFL